MKAIKILRNTGASGQTLIAGKVYAVGKDVSEVDAKALIKFGRAEAVNSPVKKRASK